MYRWGCWYNTDGIELIVDLIKLRLLKSKGEKLQLQEYYDDSEHLDVSCTSRCRVGYKLGEVMDALRVCENKDLKRSKLRFERDAFFRDGGVGHYGRDIAGAKTALAFTQEKHHMNVPDDYKKIGTRGNAGFDVLHT